MSFKSGFVTIIGRPNVGKSTLLNKIAGEKIAITSNKPQTTRNTIRTVVTNKEYQMIFIDTPGIHKPKTKLGEYMVDAATGTMKDVDAVLFLVEATEGRAGVGDNYIIEQLKNVKTPVILVINKVDKVKKETILALIQHYSELLDFKTVIPISALQGEGVEIVLGELVKLLHEGPQYFPDDMLTDQPEKVIVAEMIREKLLNLLEDEIPHGIGVEVMTFKERPGKGILDIQATIYCERDSHKGIVIGKQGAVLKKIGTLARVDIERFLGTKVYLELWVKVKADWRNSNAMLKTLGYTK